ncbi:uncharacterized protein [Nicotiana sylvestris]|uniref:uncharacterized protein n=1 Tax=Nicotiana sylvestris TaxID=4096 RepID=UPI00388CD8A5
MHHGGAKKVTVGDDGDLQMQGRICLPNVDGLRDLILEEAHNFRYSIHPGAVKMLTKSAYFIPVVVTYSSERLAEIYSARWSVFTVCSCPSFLIEKELKLMQIRWIELLKNYDINVLYHPGKANVVADALSRKSMGSLAHLETYQRPLAKEVHRLASLGVCLAGRRDFHPHSDGQVEHTIQKLEDMLRACVIDFKGSWDDHLPLLDFAYNNNYHARIHMARFEDLYGRRCRSPIEIGEAELIGPDLMHPAMEKVKIIKERLKTARSHQKSYSDVCRRDLEFQENDWVFLKVSPMKGVMRFGRKGKLSPRLDLPPEMSLVHPVFHVSMLKKVVGDPSLIVPVENIEVNEELTYEEIPVAI